MAKGGVLRHNKSTCQCCICHKKPHSDETKEKMRKAALLNPQKCWIGKKHTPETIRKMKQYVGDVRYNWKGESVSHQVLHKWVTRHKGRPKQCIVCGENKKRLEWSNIDHKYRRNLKDYDSLCVTCHRRRDSTMRKRITNRLA